VRIVGTNVFVDFYSYVFYLSAAANIYRLLDIHWIVGCISIELMLLYSQTKLVVFVDEISYAATKAF
jgi:hypothetical protein